MIEPGTIRRDRGIQVVELRDVADARRYVVQGIHFQRAVPPRPDHVGHAFKTALAIAGSGDPLPPLGFIADLWQTLFETDRGEPLREKHTVLGWPAHQSRAYEDYVLGKCQADWTIERASDALRRYASDERSRGLAYVVLQMRTRGHIGGADLSPAVIRELLSLSPEDAFRAGIDSLAETGPHPLLLEQYAELVAAIRRMHELLGPEDLVALEQRTALAEHGQYVAHRQILQTAAAMESRLPARAPQPRSGRKVVPTRVADEDIYPVGGYSSIGTKGSIESLLHSQLAYMEPEVRTDLFAVKFVRDELFYYTRDENQFLRRKRAFVFRFDSSLASARTKDPDAPVQRIVLALSATFVLVRKLIDWLSTDALRIDLLFDKVKEQPSLGHEFELLKTLFREPIERGVVRVDALTSNEADERLDELGRTHQLHVVTVATDPRPPLESNVAITVTSSRPEWTDSNGIRTTWPDEDPISSWSDAILAVLREWV